MQADQELNPKKLKCISLTHGRISRRGQKYYFLKIGKIMCLVQLIKVTLKEGIVSFRQNKKEVTWRQI
jgi:hypothetical protein